MAAAPSAAAGEAGAPPLAGVFSSGRSGSTWLGAILNSHPDVAYRFEPFHRLLDDPAVRRARARLESEDVADADLVPVYETLRRAHPTTDKPPFFAKAGAAAPRVPGLLSRQLLWPAAGRTPRLADLYGACFTPRGRPLVVFKEVTFEHVMSRLLARTGLRAAYLVRHPCAVVSSTLAGQRAGMMPTGRLAVLDSLLAGHDPELAARLAGRLPTLGAAERNALLWRIEVETGVAAARNHPRATIVVYEDLCERALEVSAAVLAHFGLAPTEQTRRFLDESSQAGGRARWKRGEQFIGGYFSVFRDPRESRDKWKAQLAAEDRKAVFDMVRDSPAFASCAERGGWDVD